MDGKGEEREAISPQRKTKAGVAQIVGLNAVGHGGFRRRFIERFERERKRGRSEMGGGDAAQAQSLLKWSEA
jgi:hypothetical protein